MISNRRPRSDILSESCDKNRWFKYHEINEMETG